MQTATPSCSASMNSICGESRRAFMNPCSVVLGLPKIRRTPSAMSCSIIARLPVILGMVGPQESFEGFRRTGSGTAREARRPLLAEGGHAFGAVRGTGGDRLVTRFHVQDV